jgi:hypothetical protein
MPAVARLFLRSTLPPALRCAIPSSPPTSPSRSISASSSFQHRSPNSLKRHLYSASLCLSNAYPFSASNRRSFSSFSSTAAAANPPPGLTGLAVDIAACTDSLAALGLPLTCAIAAVAVAFRSALLPLVLDQVRASNRFASFIMPVLSQRFAAIGARPRDERGAAYAQLLKHTRHAWKAAHCPPWRCFFATAVTIPAFIFFGMAIRQCALAGLPGWAIGGSLWFTNLCAPDPLLILPVANAAVLLGNMFFSMPDNPSSPVSSYIKDALLFLPLAALPLTVTPPSSRHPSLQLPASCLQNERPSHHVCCRSTSPLQSTCSGSRPPPTPLRRHSTTPKP